MVFQPAKESLSETERTGDELFASYLARREAGEAVDFEELVHAHPRHASTLRVLRRDWEVFESCFSELVRGETPPVQGDKPAETVFHKTPAALGAGEREESSSTRPVQIGDVVAGFEIVEFISQGGMGQVWEASQPALDRQVALKFIRPDRLTSDAVQFFGREARAAGRLQHPGIVAVYDAGKSEGRHWIAQELVPGCGTLHDFLVDARARPSLPADYFRRVARFFADVADALHVAHEAGVIHRDLKPSNILVTRDDMPKVSDFGLARLDDERSLSGSGALLGTLPYMSPEQTVADPLDRRTDVYSLGAILYEVLTLRRPFEGDSDLIEKIRERDPAPPRELNERVPPDLGVIALVALQKRPVDRFPTMAALAGELRRYLDGKPLEYRPPGALGRARRWVQRNPGRVAAAVAVVGLIALSGHLYVQTDRQRVLVAEERRKSAFTEAQWAIHQGDVDQAALLIAGVQEEDPAEYLGHMILAEGYARFGRFEEMERELDLARAKGFVAAPGALRSSIDHTSYALSLLTERKRGVWDEAERHLERALELDPSAFGNHFPLYQIRLARGDREGAREAFEAYRRYVPPGAAYAPLLTALSFELGGEHRDAIAVLEELRSGPEALDAETADELRLDRLLGRNHLELGEWEAALPYLERAVELGPTDYASWANLALARLHANGAGAGELEPAREAAERALAISADAADAYVVLARVALREGRQEELRAALAGLAEHRPDHPDLPILEAELFYYDAALAQGRGEDPVPLLDASLRRNPRHLSSLVHRANVAAQVGAIEERDFAGALERFLSAASIAEEARRDGAPVKAPVWHMILVGRFQCAAALGDEENAWPARRALEDELAAGVRIDPIERMNFAEALTASWTDAALHDCDLALAIVDDPELRGELARMFPPGTPEDAQVARMLEEIERACR